MLDRNQYIGQNAVLVYRTKHIDRAGMTGSSRIVTAEIVDIDDDGVALLVSEEGIHLRFPVEMLGSAPDATRYAGGHEVIRDFHSAVEPCAARWLDEREWRHELSAADEP